MRFVLCGTSSAGKTSIMQTFPNSFIKLSLDDIIEDESTDGQVVAALDNEYYTREHRRQVKNNIVNKIILKRLKRKSTIASKFVFDMVGGREAIDMRELLPRNTKIILVYSNPEQMISHIHKRRTTAPRNPREVFQVFSRIYKRVSNKRQTALGTVNRQSFKRALQAIKYEFTSLNDLEAFADVMFAKLGIRDDETHAIAARNEAEYDFIIITKGLDQTNLRNRILSEFN